MVAEYAVDKFEYEFIGIGSEFPGRMRIEMAEHFCSSFIFAGVEESEKTGGNTVLCRRRHNADGIVIFHAVGLRHGKFA